MYRLIVLVNFLIDSMTQLSLQDYRRTAIFIGEKLGIFRYEVFMTAPTLPDIILQVKTFSKIKYMTTGNLNMTRIERTEDSS